MSLGKHINKISKSNRILYTTPSHDRTSFINPLCSDFIGRKFFYHDLSEINDLDNLTEPNGIILNSMKQSADLLGVENIFYLTNGSSSGIIASMIANLSQNDEVLIARNCHKSVLNGLILTGAKPIWFLPDINKDWGIFNPINPEIIEEYLNKNKKIKAVIITSPTYEGINSDVENIAQICHKYNTILIVDEAHGALKSFEPNIFGKNAVTLGADISVQSLHKTCGAPNPCAILLCNKTVDRSKIQTSLNLINTTSPSYPMLIAIEATINYLCSNEGKNKIQKLLLDISELKKAFSNYENIKFCNFNDKTKLLIKIKGLSGFDLSDILYDEFNIEDELTNNYASLLLTGIGTSKHKIKTLEKALKSILTTNYSYPKWKKEHPIIIPQTDISPREAYFASNKEISIEKSIGKVCAEIISEYPPGIPLLIPGEKITEEHINYLKNSRDSINIVR